MSGFDVVLVESQQHQQIRLFSESLVVSVLIAE
jgi:hypothetical protein